ncbi:hypothetical protein QBC37DRAFT_487555 [Rhypophila decipiens]|uniref:Uncharacterized protein n=1 Tax=Rhypophila decipiens TaxID=261697 RepID=A0AAN6XVF8_9PEZI|nr:hypothetical protein QBC37DRAFT_487555 [Rhypophila decipiens]
MLLNRAENSESKHQEEPAVLAIAKRDIIPWGGYPLLVSSENSCPNDTTRCGRQGCCPNATFCNTNGPAICCPKEEEDCSDIVERVYACADTSWNMWNYLSNFCCEADKVGTHANLEDRCLPTNIPVPSSIIVSSVQQQTKTRPVNSPGTTGSGPRPTSPSGGSDSGSGSGSGSDPPDSSGSDSGSGSGSGSGTGAGTGTGSNTGSSDSNNGLSTPATIAIAVLATALGLALLFMGWFLWYRSHKKKQIKAAAAGAGGMPELPATHAQVVQVPSTYAATGTGTGTGMSFVSGSGTGNVAPQQASQTMSQPLLVPVHSTPSPGPSLDPPVGPPAYVPPHSHTQELHGQGVTPGGYVIQNQTYTAPNGEQELDGITRVNAAYAHPGGDFGGQEDCSPSPVEVGGPAFGR